MQYFLGLSEYSDKAPFDASMMVYFRKRLNLELVGRINVSGRRSREQVVKGSKTLEQTPSMEQTRSTDEDKENDEEGAEAALAPPNQGQLIVDASCAPADIRYPTDLNLLMVCHSDTVFGIFLNRLERQF